MKWTVSGGENGEAAGNEDSTINNNNDNTTTATTTNGVPTTDTSGSDIPGLHRAKNSPKISAPVSSVNNSNGTNNTNNTKSINSTGLVVNGVRLRSLKQKSSNMVVPRVQSLSVMNGDEPAIVEELVSPGMSTTQYPVELRLQVPQVVTSYKIQTSSHTVDCDPSEWVIEGLDSSSNNWVEIHRAGPPLYILPSQRNAWSELYKISYDTSQSQFYTRNTTTDSQTTHYIVGVQSQDSHRQLYRLLSERSVRDYVRIHYKQEEVTTSSIKGTLLVVSPRESSVWAYVVWSPYCLLMTVNPDLLSQKAKASLDSLDGLPIFAGEEEDEILYEGPFRNEWKHACVIPDSKLLTLRKDTKMWGVRSVTVTSSPDPESNCLMHTHGPFQFKLKGLTAFLKELSKHISVATPVHDDKLIVVERLVMGKGGVMEASSPLGNDSFGILGEDSPITESSNILTASFAKSRKFGKEMFSSIGRRNTDNIYNSSMKDSDRESPPGSPYSQSSCHSPGIRDCDLPVKLPPPFTDEEIAENNRGPVLTKEAWDSAHDHETGSLLESEWLRLKTVVHKGGIDESAPEVRKELWGYLLGVYTVGDSSEDRQRRLKESEDTYEIYKQQWQSITEKQKGQFFMFRDRLQRIEKDVIRTDRTVDIFIEDNGEGMVAIHNVLLTYSFYNFDLGYCQGMSDIVSTLYHVFRNEAESFTSFCHLMETRIGTNFQKDQSGVGRNLASIGKLIELSKPELISYLDSIDSLNFYFCFRWLVVTFKREFPFNEVTRLWDIIWTFPFDPNYEMVMSAALLNHTADTILSRNLSFDEILKFNNDLSQQIPLNFLLRKSEELYTQICESCGTPTNPYPSLKDLGECREAEAF